MGNMKFTDRTPIGKTQITSEGYLKTEARALRTGVQEYLPSELGLIGDSVIRVYRPEDSVKDVNSLASLSHAPVTMGHPDDEVSAANWRELAVGEVSTAARWDGDFISLPLILKDANAIEAVKNGRAELSAGYTADMVAVEHADYDFVMGPPKYNHIAIVDNARAGKEARIPAIGDAAKQWGAAPLSKPDKKEPEMDIVKVMIGDKAVSVAATDAEKITQMVSDHAAKVAEMQSEIEARDAAIGEKMAEITNLEAKVITDADIEAKAEDRAEVIGKASKMIDGFDAKGKGVMEIKRAALATIYDADKVAEYPDVAVDAMFENIEVNSAKPDPVRAAAKDAKMKRPDYDDVWGTIRKKKGDKK